MSYFVCFCLWRSLEIQGVFHTYVHSTWYGPATRHLLNNGMWLVASCWTAWLEILILGCTSWMTLEPERVICQKADEELSHTQQRSSVHLLRRLSVNPVTQQEHKDVTGRPTHNSMFMVYFTGHLWYMSVSSLKLCQRLKTFSNSMFVEVWSFCLYFNTWAITLTILGRNYFLNFTN